MEKRNMEVLMKSLDQDKDKPMSKKSIVNIDCNKKEKNISDLVSE